MIALNYFIINEKKFKKLDVIARFYERIEEIVLPYNTVFRNRILKKVRMLGLFQVSINGYFRPFFAGIVLRCFIAYSCVLFSIRKPICCDELKKALSILA